MTITIFFHVSSWLDNLSFDTREGLLATTCVCLHKGLRAKSGRQSFNSALTDWVASLGMAVGEHQPQPSLTFQGFLTGKASTPLAFPDLDVYDRVGNRHDLNLQSTSLNLNWGSSPESPKYS